MPNTKPYVAVACLCEKVLMEADGVASAIRIVDTFTIQPPVGPLPPGVAGAISFTVFISVKSGDVTGQHEIGLVMRQPNGKSGEPYKWPVVLTGGENGANLKIDFNLGLKGEPTDFGLYWFDVLWGADVLTSIPLKLKQAEPPAPAAPTAR